jgi:hypothetical protein
MKLYHGTNGQWLSRILRTGLKPRGLSGGRSNWNHSVRSNPRCVYLTDSYAAYFAFNASRGNEPQCAVIEIDTDLLDDTNLFPDEDFLEQASRRMKDAVPGDMKQRTLHYRKNQFTYDWPCENPADGSMTTWWEASLTHLGTCSHRGEIPVSAITRAITWPHKPNAWMPFLIDPTISLINQQICGDRYREITRNMLPDEFTSDEELASQTAEARFFNPLLPVIKDWQVINQITAAYNIDRDIETVPIV